MEANGVRFSTADATDSDPLLALRELNERNVVLRLDALAGIPILADVAVLGGPPLRVMSASFRGVRQGMAPGGDGAGGGDHLFLGIPLWGRNAVRQGTRELTASDGDAVLLQGERSFSVTHREHVRFLGLR